MSYEPIIDEINSTIAVFMGLIPIPSGTKRLGDIKYPEEPVGFLDYEKNWDSLHEVWERFRDLKFTEETPMKLHLNYVARLAQDIAYGTIEEFHHNIHIAIQWYNKQSTTTNEQNR